MSFKTPSTRSILDSQDYLYDFEDLDYEPDGIEKPKKEEPVPKSRESSYLLESYASTRKQNYNCPPSVSAKSSSLYSFRNDLNYKHLEITPEENSFRSQYNSYLSSEESCHLDSSDEEDSYSAFGSPSFNSGLYCTNETKNESSHCTNSICSQALSVATKISPDSKSILGWTNSSSSVMDNLTLVEDNLPIPVNKPDTPISKPAAFNFTIQVTGERRCFLNNSRMKRKQKPWLITMRSCLEDIIILKSNDAVVKFLPVKDVQVSSPRFSSRCSGSNKSEESTTIPSVFKIPLKRPPTRQKGFIYNTPVPESSIEDVINVEDSCDIISLIASTNIEEEHFDDTINNEVKSEPTSLPISQLPDKITSEEVDKMDRVAEWVETSNQTTNSISKRQKVPPIYKGLCFNYFFSDNCRLVICAKRHNLQTKLKQIFNLPEDLFQVAYNFAKLNPIFFKKIYKEFANMFAIKGNKTELVNMLDLFFVNNHPDLDSLEGLTTILQSLEKTDLGTFENSVNFILFQVDYGGYAKLGLQLLEIIVSMNQLPKHWLLIQKLFARGTKMPTKLAQRFIAHLMKPPVDYNVCKEVCEHINRYNCLDLHSIHVSIREPFLKLCRAANSGIYPDEIPSSTLTTENSQQPVVAHGDTTAPGNSQDSSAYYSAFSLVQPADFQQSNTSQESNSVKSLNFIPPSEVDFSDFNDESHRSSSVDLSESYQYPALPDTGTEYPVQKEFILPNTEGYRLDRKRKKSFSSSEGSDSNQRPKKATGNWYIQEGLHYDPITDYRPLPPKVKRRQGLDDVTITTFPSKNVCLEPSAEIMAKQNNITRIQKDVCNRNSATIGALKVLEAMVNENGSATLNKMASKSNSNVSAATDSSNEFKFEGQSVRKVSRATEEQVSSSSDIRNRNEKLTDHPRFGYLHFDPNYDFNVSLHNLYLDRIDNIDIDEDDVLALNDCVKVADGEKFLELSYKYQRPTTIQNFISMTLAHLKGMNQMIARKYKNLLSSIEDEKPDFYKCLKVRVILEVITMNLLFILESRNMFVDAQYLLTKFSNWDSLVTSRLFITNAGTAMSIMGRYLFIARLLVQCKPELTYEILDCPTFKFFDANHTWPYHPPSPIPEIFNSDLEARNRVLEQLLKNGYHLNIVTVIQLYKKALSRKQGIWLFDVKPFIEPMITSIINNVKPAQVKQIFGEIHIFQNYLQKRTLRALLVTMYPYLNKTDCFRFFEICATKNVYNKLVNGDTLEHVIEIKTNMHPCEIELIILYYFYQLKEIKNLPPGSDSLKFKISLPGADFPCKYLPILNLNRSVKQITEDIKKCILTKCSIEAKVVSSNLVIVEKNDLIRYLIPEGKPTPWM